MTWEAAAEADYDKAIIDAVSPHIRPHSTILDVGASLGLWTVQLARIARARDVHVHAFEPNPSNTPWLRRNLELNGLQSIVTVHEMALGERPAVAWLGHTEHGIGNGAILASGDDTNEARQVQVCRLDDLDLHDVSFIKLDVEGFEPAILRGGTQLLAQEHPVIFGEFSTDWMRLRRESPSALIDGLGYNAHAVSTRRSRPWRPIDIAAVTPAAGSVVAENMLLVPRAIDHT